MSMHVISIYEENQPGSLHNAVFNPWSLLGLSLFPMCLMSVMSVYCLYYRKPYQGTLLFLYENIFCLWKYELKKNTCPKWKSAKVRVMRAYILCRADQTSKAGIYGTVFYFVWVSAEWAFNLLHRLRCTACNSLWMMLCIVGIWIGWRVGNLKNTLQT